MKFSFNCSIALNYNNFSSYFCLMFREFVVELLNFCWSPLRLQNWTFNKIKIKIKLCIKLLITEHIPSNESYAIFLRKIKFHILTAFKNCVYFLVGKQVFLGFKNAHKSMRKCLSCWVRVELKIVVLKSVEMSSTFMIFKVNYHNLINHPLRII
jgi:hypothetical protein